MKKGEEMAREIKVKGTTDEAEVRVERKLTFTCGVLALAIAILSVVLPDKVSIYIGVASGLFGGFLIGVTLIRGR